MHTLGRKILAMTLSGVIAFNSAPINIWAAENTTESQSNPATEPQAPEPATQPASQEQTQAPEPAAETNPPTEANVPTQPETQVQTETSAQTVAPEQTIAMAQAAASAQSAETPETRTTPASTESTDVTTNEELSTEDIRAEYSYKITLQDVAKTFVADITGWTVQVEGQDPKTISFKEPFTAAYQEDEIEAVLQTNMKNVLVYTQHDGQYVNTNSLHLKGTEGSSTGEFNVVAPIADAKLKVLWNDNNTEQKADADIAYKVLYRLKRDSGASEWKEYIQPNGTSYILTDAEKAQGSNVSSYVFSLRGDEKPLYAYLLDEDGKTFREAEYCLGLAKDSSEYAADYIDQNGEHILHLTKKVPFKATVEWKDNVNEYASRMDFASWIDNMELRRYVMTNGDVTKGLSGEQEPITLSTSDPNAEGYITYEEAVDEKSGSVYWNLVLPNALGYDTNNKQYNYYLVHKNAAMAVTAGKYKDAKCSYVPKYENVSNFATNEQFLFADGTIKETLTGTTQFQVKKVWKDSATGVSSDEADELRGKRPSATLDIWVYPDNVTEGYKTASPVAIEGSSNIEIKTDDTSTITYEGKKNTEADSSEELLPRFDADGVALVYFGKEHINQTEGKNSYTSDVEPKKVTVNAENIADQKNQNRYTFLSDDDVNNGRFKNYVWNGDTIYNRITGTTSIHVTKKWLATDRADYDAKITLQVLRKGKNDEAFTPVEGATAVLTGFSAERQSMDHTFSNLPEYDENGLPYVYKVQEGAVEVSSTPGTIAQKFETAKINGEDIRTEDGYHYQQCITSSENGKEYQITNKLVGSAQVVVHKIFPGGFRKGDDRVKMTFTVYRDNKKLGTFERTVTAKDCQPLDEKGLEVNFVLTRLSDLKDCSEADGLLPRYDDNGKAYRYYVRETAAIGQKKETASTEDGTVKYEDTQEYKPSRQSDSESDSTYNVNTLPTTDASNKIHYETDDHYRIFTTEIENPIDNSGMTFTVYKTWLDGNERQYRKTVTFEVQKKTKESDGWKTVSTSEHTIGANEEFVYVSFVDGNDETAADNQKAFEEWIKGGCMTDISKSAQGVVPAFRVIETKVGDTQVISAKEMDSPEKKEKYPEHTTLENAFAPDTDQYWDVSNDGVATVEGRSSGSKTCSFRLTNVRVGVVQIQINKTWADNSNNYKTRPDVGISFTVKGDDHSSRDITVKPGAAADSNHWTVTSDYLPKYTENGEHIHYTIGNEQLNYSDDNYGKKASKSKDLYASSMTGGSYKVGEAHTKDLYTYDYTNTLTDTVTPYMNKYWKDKGDAKAIASRPNIYGVVYRAVDSDGDGVFNPEKDIKDTEEEKLVKLPFVESKWNTRKITRNWWINTFEAMPRFDKEGRLYFYLIGEGYNGSDNGYKYTRGYKTEPAQVGTNSDAAQFLEQEAEQLTISYDKKEIPVALFTYPIGAKAAHGGTLVNKPDAGRTLKGTKTYENLPSGFDLKKVPKLTFTLYRVAYADQEKLPRIEDEKGNFVAYDLAKGLESGKLQVVTYANARTKHLNTAQYPDNVNQSGAVTAELSSGETKFSFTYPAGTKDKKTKEDLAGKPVVVDKYDSTGMPYLYLFLETAPEKMDVIFALSENSENGITAKNSYRSDQNHSITLTKSWDFGSYKSEILEKQLPQKAEFYLYRYRVNPVSEGTAGAIQFKGVKGWFLPDRGTCETKFAIAEENDHGNTAELSWTADEIKPENNSKTITWKNLAYYAPNGYPYYYEIQEVCDAKSNVIAYNAKKDGAIYSVNDNKDRFLIPVTSDMANVGKTADATSYASSASVVNVYGEKTGTIHIEKQWSGDDVTALQTRPDSVRMRLYRTSASSTEWEYVDLSEATVDEKNNAMTNGGKNSHYGHAVAANQKVKAEFVLLQDTKEVQNYNPNKWTCNIKDLQIYAPDGQPYSYGIEEVSMKVGTKDLYPEACGYTVGATKTAQAKPEGQNLQTVSLVNTMKETSASADAEFVFTDADEKVLSIKASDLPSELSYVPTKISYRVFYRIKGNDQDSWQILKDASEKDIVLTGTQVQVMNLPTRMKVSGQMKNLEYKICESSLTYKDGNADKIIGLEDQALILEADENKAMLGSTKVTASSKEEDAGTFATKITNTLQLKKLILRQTWDDDGNRDGYRPDSVNVTVTRMQVASDASTASVVLELSADQKPDTLKTNEEAAATWKAQGQNQGLTLDDLWEREIYVPIYRNDDASRSKKSAYRIVTSYDAKQFTADHYPDTYDGLKKDITKVDQIIDLSTDETFASFVNVHTPWDTFKIQLEKTWIVKTGEVTRMYHSGSDIPREVAEYLEAQINDPQCGTLAFKLQYRAEGDESAAWTDLAIKTVEYRDGKLVIAPWENLPIHVPKAKQGDAIKNYEYRVIEGYVKDEQFTPISESKDGCARNFSSKIGQIRKIDTTVKNQTVSCSAENSLVTRDLSITKSWTINGQDDTADTYNMHPDAVTYRLQRSTTPDQEESFTDVPDYFTVGSSVRSEKTSEDDTYLTYTAAKEQNYEVTFAGLPKYDPSGNAYTYRAVEESYQYKDAAGKIITYKAADFGEDKDETGKPFYAEKTAVQEDEQKVSITNILNTRDYTAKLVWKDARGKDEQPEVETMTVDLLCSLDGDSWQPVMKKGQAISVELTASEEADKNWTYHWDDLPKMDVISGKLWQYRVVEKHYRVTGEDTARTVEEPSTQETGRIGEYVYQSDYTDANASVITNVADQVSVKVTKVWRGDTSITGGEVKSSTIQLQRRHAADAGQKDTNKEAWTNVAGKVLELPKTDRNSTDSDCQAFRNLPALDNQGKAYEYRCIETGITVQQADGKTEFIATTFAGSEDGQVNETKGVAGNYAYVATTLKTRSEDQSYYKTAESIILNTMITTRVDLTVNWDDNHDADTIRPKQVTYKLLANAVAADEFDLTVEDPQESAQWYWDKLPAMMADGKTAIRYGVVEVDEEGELINQEEGAYNEAYKATTICEEAQSFTVTNYHNATDLSFGIKISYNEQNKRTALNGAVFGFYTDEACTDLVLTAVSGKVTSAGSQPLEGVTSVEGQVHVHGILEPDTTYYVKELASNEEDYGKGTSTDNIVEDANVYTVTFTGQETQGLLTKDGGVVMNLVNDVNRSSVVIDKIDSTSGQPVAGATLGLFRRRNTVKKLTVHPQQDLDRQEEWTDYVPFASYTSSMRSYKAGTFDGSPAMAKVMKTITENDLEPVDAVTTNGSGQAVFNNLIAGQEYVILDLHTADGYKPEAQPIHVTCEKDLTKTVTMKTEKTEMVIERKDAEGHLIGGFVVRIRDKDGNPVKDINGNIIPDMTTNPGKQLVIPGLPDGEYVVSDVKAPKGYELTKPVTVSMDHEQVMSGDPQANTFAIENGRVNAVVKKKKNQKSETQDNTKQVTGQQQGSPADAKAAKTADETPIECMSLLMLSALLMAIVLFRRKRQYK